MEDTAARSNIPALVWILDKLNECPYVASASEAIVYLRLAAAQIEANPSLLKKRAAAADRVPTLEELIDDCIAHQDVPQAARLLVYVAEMPADVNSRRLWTKLRAAFPLNPEAQDLSGAFADGRREAAGKANA